MRKYLLSTLCMMALATAQMTAREVTSTEAANIASRFGMTTSQALRSKALVQPQLVYTEQQNGQNLFYVFNRPGRGYIIIAADDNATSVLAYSDTQSFTSIDAIPSNMRSWLADYAQQIKSVAGRSDVQAPKKVAREAIAPLIHTQWNQNEPFSTLCTLNGEECVTGCVATTMAQIMNYHRWPTTGLGSETWVWKGQDFVANYSEHTYDWDNMLPCYFDLENRQIIPSTDEQKASVAQLCYDAAVSVHMQFDKSNSASATADVPLALINHFGYSKNMKLETRSFYNDATWEDMIYQQLRNNVPVIYAGTTDSKAGHTFIIDGANEDGLFHVNWGWGGMNDGYFALTAVGDQKPEDILKPESQGAGGAEEGSTGYYLSQGAIFDIVPDKDGTSDYYIRFLSTKQQELMTVFQQEDGTATEAVPVTEAINRPTMPNQWLRVKGNFINASLVSRTIKLGIQLKKKDSDFSRIFEQPQAGDGTIEFESRGYSQNIRIPYADLETLPDGEYIVTPLWYDVVAGKWFVFTDTDAETSEPVTLTLTGQHDLYVSSSLTPSAETMNSDNIQLSLQVASNANVDGYLTAVIYEEGEDGLLYEHPSRYQRSCQRVSMLANQAMNISYNMNYNVYNIKAVARVFFSKDPNDPGVLLNPQFDDQAFFTISTPSNPANFKDFVDLQAKPSCTEAKNLSFEVSFYSNTEKDMTFVIPYLAQQSAADNQWYLVNDCPPIVQTVHAIVGENTFTLGPVDSKVTNLEQPINTFVSLIDTPNYDGDFNKLERLFGMTFNITATAIHGVSPDKADFSTTPVYNLSGARVGQASNMRSLPKGIYIVNGKKVAVK